MSAITDTRGTEVEIDDIIAVAATGYNHHPQIRIGQVLAFKTRASNTTGQPDTLEVLWHHVSAITAKHLVGDTSRIDATKKRFVVIGKVLEGQE